MRPACNGSRDLEILIVSQLRKNLYLWKWLMLKDRRKDFPIWLLICQSARCQQNLVKKLSIFCKVITFIKSVRAFCLYHLSRMSSASFLSSGLQSAPLFAYWDLRPESSDIFLFIWLAKSELDSCTQSTSDGDRSKYKLHTCNLWSCSLLWSVRFLRVSSISVCICCIPPLMESDDILNARHSLLFAWEHREINLLPLSSIPRTRCLKIVTCLQTSPLEITTNITQLRTSCRRSYLNTSVLLAEMSPRLFLFLPRNL